MMYQDMKHTYCWIDMKRDVRSFVSKCLTCQLVKAEHQFLSGLLKLLSVSNLKWECVYLSLCARTSKITEENDSIFVVVDN